MVSCFVQDTVASDIQGNMDGPATGRGDPEHGLYGSTIDHVDSEVPGTRRPLGALRATA